MSSYWLEEPLMKEEVHQIWPEAKEKILSQINHLSKMCVKHIGSGLSIWNVLYILVTFFPSSLPPFIPSTAFL